MLSFGVRYTQTSSGGSNFDSVFGSPPIIAPFWDDINIRVGGVIYYRQEFDPFIVDLVREGVASQFPEVGFFFPSLVFVATWDRVAPFGSRSGFNTFQAVIASDGSRTFVRFTYGDIQWGGNSTLIGVSAGDQRNFITHPASLSPSVVFLDGTNVTYRIDREFPLTELWLRLMLTAIVCLLQLAMRPHVNVFSKEISSPT